MYVTAIDKKKRIHMARKSNSTGEYKKESKNLHLCNTSVSSHKKPWAPWMRNLTWQKQKDKMKHTKKMQLNFYCSKEKSQH